MTIWFTGDTHYGHGNIIKHCNRPYADSIEMDENMEERWKDVVLPKDEVYHLGDVAFYQHPGQVVELFNRLPGRKYLLKGNHDRKDVVKALIKSGGVKWAKDYHMLRIGGKKVILSHYAFEVWDGHHRGSYHLHGHSHGTLATRIGRLDVGVDVAFKLGQGYAPIPWELVDAVLGDRHGG